MVNWRRAGTCACAYPYSTDESEIVDSVLPQSVSEQSSQRKRHSSQPAADGSLAEWMDIMAKLIFMLFVYSSVALEARRLCRWYATAYVATACLIAYPPLTDTAQNTYIINTIFAHWYQEGTCLLASTRVFILFFFLKSTPELVVTRQTYSSGLAQATEESGWLDSTISSTGLPPFSYMETILSTKSENSKGFFSFSRENIE